MGYADFHGKSFFPKTNPEKWPTTGLSYSSLVNKRIRNKSIDQTNGSYLGTAKLNRKGKGSWKGLYFTTQIIFSLNPIQDI